MQKATIAKAGISASVALALSFGVMAQAHADIQPTTTDAVAVGSDTVQYVVDFLDDGDTNLHTGYNTVTKNRVFSFDATADASGRAAYLNSTSTALPSSIVLRQGSKPVTRPNGSGAGITALLGDTTHKIDFVRSSRLPTAAEEATALTAFNGFHVYQIATDGLQIAVAQAGTNAPAGLSADEIANIYDGTYKTWGDIPGYTGTAAQKAHGIVPVIPQVGSGTRNDFIANIKTLTGVDLAASGVLASNVVTGEEHDPTAITNIVAHNDVNGNPVTSADGISPFSTGRDKLIDTGYFGTTPAPNTINLLNGASPDGEVATSYLLNRFLYIIARQTDAVSTTPFQSGSSLNLVNTLFGSASSWYGKPANAALFTSAGVTRAWVDKGINPTS
ncbi:PBP superfamily domain-containing protein [Frankineae bacterium MT45]|nr:PBP superfamily domain-containing protein [Frankineae bacterium MT45]